MLGVIVFAHGSRDPLWRAPIDAVATRLKNQHTPALVECAYLELCEPDINTACRSLLQAGATHIRILPLFFGMGKHAREDLPLLIEQLTASHPKVRFECLPAAGEDPRLTALLATIALESEA